MIKLFSLIFNLTLTTVGGGNGYAVTLLYHSNLGITKLNYYIHNDLMSHLLAIDYYPNLASKCPHALLD